jgi:hypothetical protein
LPEILIYSSGFVQRNPGNRAKSCSRANAFF